MARIFTKYKLNPSIKLASRLETSNIGEQVDLVIAM